MNQKPESNPENNESKQTNENEAEQKENEVNKEENDPLEKNEEGEKKTKSKASSKLKVGLEDFEIMGCLGNGSFGEVSLVKKKDSEQFYAMKAINKNFLFKVKKK